VTATRRPLRAPFFLAALVVTALAGCESASRIEAPPRDTAATTPPPVRADEPVQTDSLVYSATVRSTTRAYTEYGFTVVARYTNRTAAPVYVANCFPQDSTPVYLVVMADTSAARTGGTAYARLWGCVGHDHQPEVLPGATRVDTLRLRGPNVLDASLVPVGAFSGRMRIVYWLRGCRGEGCPLLPREASQSNAFDVRIAP